MAFKSLVTTLTLVFNAGTILLLFFIILGGAFDKFPLNHFYFFQADTSGINGAPSQTRWTLWGYCENKDGTNSNCSSNKPAFAFQPDKTFGTEDGVPKDIVTNHSTYYYLTRFAFPFYLIGLFFTVVSFVLGLMAYLSRLGAALSSVITFIAFLFVAAASAVITANYVMARDAFSDQNNDASLGVKMFAFTWTATALLLFSVIGFCMGWHRSTQHQRTTGGLARSSSFEKSHQSSATAGGPKKRGFFNVGKRNNNYDDDDDFVRGGETGSQNPVIAPISSYERGAPGANQV